MVGKKWRKAAAVGIAGVLAVGVLAGCGNSSGTGSNGKMKIGVVQIVQHPALDESNRGFVDALAARGLKDKIEIDQQNAQGDQSNLRSIANRFVSGNYNLICAILRRLRRLWRMPQIKSRLFVRLLLIMKMRSL